MRLFRCVSEKKIIFLLNCVFVKLITESACIMIKALAYRVQLYFFMEMQEIMTFSINKYNIVGY